MVDEQNDQVREDQNEDPNKDLNTDYYDKVEEGAHERSRENTSVADPHARDLWQSTNISTDDTGPRVEDVAPVFAQARADALAHPVTADDDDEDVANDNVASPAVDGAEAAQAKADEIRNSGGYVAATGADAGVYDDPKLEGQVPSENFSAAPELDEEERDSNSVAEQERLNVAGAQNAHTDEVDQQVPAKADETDDSEENEA